MKQVKIFISAVMAAISAFIFSASVTAEIVTEPQLVDINGYSCFERDGQYWTMLDGVEYLVINIDEFAEPDLDVNSEISPQYNIADECPIGAPSPYDWIYNGYVELTENNNYSYTDRCYLTYGDYYSPIYYFKPKNPNSSFAAKISANVSSFDTYYIQIWQHNTAFGWMNNKSNESFNLLLREHTLFTGTTTQLVDGLGFRFISDGVRQQQLYYTVDLVV